MDLYYLELLTELGVKTVQVKGWSTEEYGHRVPVEFPDTDITTCEGRGDVALQCDTIDDISEIVVNGRRHYTLDELSHRVIHREEIN